MKRRVTTALRAELERAKWELEEARLALRVCADALKDCDRAHFTGASRTAVLRSALVALGDAGIGGES